MFDVFGIGKDFVTEDTMDGIDPGNNCFQGNDLDDLELMQFTGLHDKNGKEIYEGDVWQRDGFIGAVVFEKCEWRFKQLPKSSCIEYPYFYDNANKGKVIGNIHQNKELIKTK